MPMHIVVRALRAISVSALVLYAGLQPTRAQPMPGSPDQADMQVDSRQREQLLTSVIRELNAGYIFPELAKKAEMALRGHEARGDYAKLASAKALVELLNAHLQEVTRDGHLSVYYSAKRLPKQDAQRTPTVEAKAAELEMMKTFNFGIERVERLPFNVGYLDLRAFAPARDAAQSVAAAMTLVANAHALVIDLRKSGGGDPNTVGLIASYLFDQRTRLNDIYYREGERSEQMWTTEHVAGARFGQQKALYILTSKDTYSAAEDFAYALKNLKRAIIVGETTGGGAHPTDIKYLSDHFALGVPNARSLSPVTKTDWEGTGVTPDVKTSADDAFKVAQAAILKKLVATEKNPGKLERLKARIATVEAENAH